MYVDCCLKELFQRVSASNITDDVRWRERKKTGTTEKESDILCAQSRSKEIEENRRENGIHSRIDNIKCTAQYRVGEKRENFNYV